MEQKEKRRKKLFKNKNFIASIFALVVAIITFSTIIISTEKKQTLEREDKLFQLSQIYKTYVFDDNDNQTQIKNTHVLSSSVFDNNINKSSFERQQVELFDKKQKDNLYFKKNQTEDNSEKILVENDFPFLVKWSNKDIPEQNHIGMILTIKENFENNSLSFYILKNGDPNVQFTPLDNTITFFKQSGESFKIKAITDKVVKKVNNKTQVTREYNYESGVDLAIVKFTVLKQDILKQFSNPAVWEYQKLLNNIPLFFDSHYLKDKIQQKYDNEDISQREYLNPELKKYILTHPKNKFMLNSLFVEPVIDQNNKVSYNVFTLSADAIKDEDQWNNRLKMIVVKNEQNKPVMLFLPSNIKDLWQKLLTIDKEYLKDLGRSIILLNKDFHEINYEKTYNYFDIFQRVQDLKKLN
ncbi:hypothetical protein [Mesomycoplasma hyorhinis]|uniref:hypothetical protein n=1 Tax=Mesomycoplasma hyorhinis TaxID=2100 RepID=UPI001C056497|nr:hypothetical protein [Mesomycoplasma hyorhinis]